MIHKQRGFTLVELLVVVAIVSVLAMVVIPGLLIYLESEELAVTPEEILAVTPSDPVGPPPAPGERPVLERVRIDVVLRGKQPQIGYGVAHRYRAEVQGDLQVRVPKKPRTPVRIEVPLPRNADEIEELSLSLHGGGHDGTPLAEALEVTRESFAWTGLLSTGENQDERITVRFSFVARGHDLFSLALPPARRLEDVAIVAHLHGLERRPTPEASLTPRGESENEVRWSFQNLVSRRPIMVAFPGAGSSLGQALLLFQLTGLAVLLFGAGFWYLGEVYRAGHLDSFRWGHFLLLALNLSFFFLVFGVLSFQGVAAARSLPIAGVLALPLLVLHVGTIFDARFALTRALPLAVLTIAVVVNGVYGDAYRPAIYLAIAFVVIAGLTLTYPKLLRLRTQLASTKERQIASAIGSLAPLVQTAQAAAQSASRSLDDADLDAQAKQRTSVTSQLAALHQELNRHRSLTDDLEELQRSRASARRRDLLRSFANRCDRLTGSLGRGIRDLQASLQELVEGRERSRARLAQQQTGDIHCPSCGCGSQDARFCPGCGKPTPRPLPCGRCDEVLHLPVYLLREGIQPGQLHCMGCGEPHTLVVDGAA